MFPIQIPLETVMLVIIVPVELTRPNNTPPNQVNGLLLVPVRNQIVILELTTLILPKARACNALPVTTVRIQQCQHQLCVLKVITAPQVHLLISVVLLVHVRLEHTVRLILFMKLLHAKLAPLKSIVPALLKQL